MIRTEGEETQIKLLSSEVSLLKEELKANQNLLNQANQELQRKRQTNVNLVLRNENLQLLLESKGKDYENREVLLKASVQDLKAKNQKLLEEQDRCRTEFDIEQQQHLRTITNQETELKDLKTKIENLHLILQKKKKLGKTSNDYDVELQRSQMVSLLKWLQGALERRSYSKDGFRLCYELLSKDMHRDEAVDARLSETSSIAGSIAGKEIALQQPILEDASCNEGLVHGKGSDGTDRKSRDIDDLEEYDSKTGEAAEKETEDDSAELLMIAHRDAWHQLKRLELRKDFKKERAVLMEVLSKRIFAEEEELEQAQNKIGSFLEDEENSTEGVYSKCFSGFGNKIAGSYDDETRKNAVEFGRNVYKKERGHQDGINGRTGQDIQSKTSLKRKRMLLDQTEKEDIFKNGESNSSCKGSKEVARAGSRKRLKVN